MSQNNNFAYHVQESKKLSGLVQFHPATSQCRLTKNRRENCKAWLRLQTTLKVRECSSSALFNRCARCTLGCIKICVGCTTMKGFTRVDRKLVTPNRHFLQKLSVSKNEPLTNQWLSGFNLAFTHAKVWCVSINVTGKFCLQQLLLYRKQACWKTRKPETTRMDSKGLQPIKTHYVVSWP